MRCEVETSLVVECMRKPESGKKNPVNLGRVMILDRIFSGTKSGQVQLEPILMTIFWGLVAHSKMVTNSLADLATMAPRMTAALLGVAPCEVAEVSGGVRRCGSGACRLQLHRKRIV